jgi:hypothetical protein
MEVYLASLDDCSDFFKIWKHNTYLYSITGNNTKPLNEWYHLAYVFNGTTVSIYANGSLSGSVSDLRHPFKTSGDINFIGMSYKKNIAFVYLDEIKVFKNAFNQSQIEIDMSQRNGIAHGLC